MIWADLPPPQGTDRLLLNSIRDYEFEQRFFVGEGKGCADHQSKWFCADCSGSWVCCAARWTEQECLALLSPGELDWKLGSAGR